MKLSGSQGAGSAWESGSASRAILLISWQSELFPTGPRLLGTPISGAGGYHQPVLIDRSLSLLILTSALLSLLLNPFNAFLKLHLMSSSLQILYFAILEYTFAS